MPTAIKVLDKIPLIDFVKRLSIDEMSSSKTVNMSPTLCLLQKATLVFINFPKTISFISETKRCENL
ncbi:hypothetical protein D3C75_1079430 [compost metagenome]